MRLATEIRWQDRTFQIPLERIRLTEELGYDAVFTSEGWGSDGLTPLGYLAAALRPTRAAGTAAGAEGRSSSAGRRS